MDISPGENPPSYEEATSLTPAPAVSRVNGVSVDENAIETDSAPTAPPYQPPPAGWMLSCCSTESAVAKEKEAEAACSTSEQSTNLYPVLSDEKSSSNQSEVPTVSVTCPDGLEPLRDQAALILRENFRPDHRGGTRRGAVVLSGADPARTLLMVQRCPRGPHRHTRALELLDAAGGRVIALIESTKRLDILSVEVQCPPGSRVARAEVKPSTQPPQLAATLLSADEKPVLRLTVPPIGKIETQPLLQIQSAVVESEIKGTLQWAWGADADLLQGELKLHSDIDVRIKAALIALQLLCMEAFSRRWSSSHGSSHGRLHLHGHRRRHNR